MPASFLSGAAMLARGFGFWRRDPGAMLLGLVPAVLVFVGAVFALIGLGLWLPGVVDWATPFADAWADEWETLFRLALTLVLFAGTTVLVVLTFTAVTLAVGDPFYERIWRAVELDLGGDVPDSGPGFWRAARDGLVLILLGVLAAIAAGIAGLVPIVGAVLGPVVGVTLGGSLLARELTSRAFDARGIRGDERRAMLRPHRAQVLGFGVATQLCFLIPLGAVATMPAAVAGSTMLARQVIDAAAQPRDAERAEGETKRSTRDPSSRSTRSGSDHAGR